MSVVNRRSSGNIKYPVVPILVAREIWEILDKYLPCINGIILGKNIQEHVFEIKKICQIVHKNGSETWFTGVTKVEQE
jgi:hypothetical protein